ncbi:MAG TPA: metalloregulator ArsR/SmtB family transcription factor [Blastocatellia bacterium]|nr:metalloregulator ArsR/SmtB family transcription factor [Blastocatellia bacterium]
MIKVQQQRRNMVFRAIADPTRRQILNLLRGGGRTVGEIAGNFRTSRPAISKHLRLLRTAGLVASHQKGATRVYGLKAKPLRAVDDWLRDYQAFWGDTLRSLKIYAEENQNETDKRYRHDRGRNQHQGSGRTHI